MADIDQIRYFNLTNATIPIYEGAGQNTNYIVYRADIDIYQKTIGYFENIDASNNTGLYPSIMCFANFQSEFILNGYIASNSTAVFAIGYVIVLANFEAYNLYFEQVDAVQDLIFETSFIFNMKIDNITVNNNDISSNDPTGIFFGNMNGASIQLSNITVTNSNFGAKHMFEYRQSCNDIIKIEDVYIENTSLGTGTKIFKTQSLSGFYMKNSTFSNVHPSNLGDSSPKFIEFGSI